MNFEVRWKRAARDELTKLWLDAQPATRKSITKASHQLDYELQYAPDTKGESRDKGRRIFHVSPLGVIFRVDEEAQRVFILHVWLFRA
jgi:mRNA-degrading endonuclease RelE of RelBE toxin-antitoxin system